MESWSWGCFSMRINNNPNINKILKKYKTNSKKVNKASKANMKKDQLSISNDARDFQVAMKAVRNTPELRQDKVDEIKQKIKDGKYNPSAKDVAKKMINQAKINRP